MRLIIVLLDRFQKGRYAGFRITVQGVLTAAVSVIMVLTGLSLYFLEKVLKFSISGTQMLIFRAVVPGYGGAL